MQRHRVLIIFGIAWISALLLSWWVYQKSTAPQSSRDLVYTVAAARDLPIGKRIQQDDLKMVALEPKDVPKGAFLNMADIVDRAVTIPLAASEPVLGSKLAAKGSGEGLTALIPPGLRAVSVQVNEISGVSGFIQPGTRVDILFTRTFSNGDAATTTILQNVKVIAYGKQFDLGVKVDPRDTSKPTVATLLVSQEQAEKLVLAGQRGRIQLVLRSPLDDDITEPPDPIRSVDLGIDEPLKPEPRVVPVRRLVSPAETREEYFPETKLLAAKSAKPENNEHLVRIFRGDKVTEIRFE